MSLGNFELNFKIVIDNSLDKELKKALKNTRKVNENLKKGRANIKSMLGPLRSLNQRFKALRSHVSGVFVLLTSIGAALFFRKIITESIRVQNALIGLQSVARALKQSVSGVTDAAKELASDGLIPLDQVSRSLKNLLATGLDADQAIRLFKALRDSAAFNRQGQLELGDAVARATDGFKNQLSTLVDNAGITKNLSILQKEYADSLGTTVGKLTEAQKVQANYVGILREASIFQGDYNKLLKTFSGALSNVSGRFKFLLAALGDTITQSRTSTKFLKQMADIFKELELFVKANSSAIGKLFVDAVLLASISIITLTKGLFVLLNIVLKGINLFDTWTRSITKFHNFIINNLLPDGLAKILKVARAIQQQTPRGLFSDEAKKGLQDDIATIELLIKKLDEIRSKTAGGLGSGGGKISLGSSTSTTGGITTSGGLQAFIRSIDKLTKSLTGSTLGDIGSGIAGGEEGAKDLLAKGLATLVGVPGLEGLFKGLFGSKEEVKAFTKAFVEAIPVIIAALIENIPVFVEAFVNAVVNTLARGIVGKIIKGLSDFFAGLANKLGDIALGFTNAILDGAEGFVSAILQGAGDFIQAIIDGITGADGGSILGTGVTIGGGSGLGVKGTILGTPFSFAKGGQIASFAHGGEVPIGNPSDTFNSRMQTGELVITRDTNRKLESFLDNQQNESSMQVIKVETELNERVLIETIINLKRTGQIT